MTIEMGDTLCILTCIYIYTHIEDVFQDTLYVLRIITLYMNFWDKPGDICCLMLTHFAFFSTTINPAIGLAASTNSAATNWGATVWPHAVTLTGIMITIRGSLHFCWLYFSLVTYCHVPRNSEVNWEIPSKNGSWVRWGHNLRMVDFPASHVWTPKHISYIDIYIYIYIYVFVLKKNHTCIMIIILSLLSLVLLWLFIITIIVIYIYI